MSRYDLKFGVAETARMLGVDRNLVKTWAYHFSDYLGTGAVPPKGMPRQFSAEDLQVFAYVSMYWEDEPDLESIKMGLNCEEHLEQPYNDLMASLTPLFQYPPDNLDETWTHGTLIGGMAEIGDTFALAESYKLAADILVDTALSTGDVFELAYPIIYNYRHATELYLKAIVVHYPKGRDGHDLLWLFQEFKRLLQTEFTQFDVTIPDWFENIVLVFNDFDPGSTTFRYGGSFKQDEMWVDLPHIKRLMNWLAESFQKVNQHRKTHY